MPLDECAYRALAIDHTAVVKTLAEFCADPARHEPQEPKQPLDVTSFTVPYDSLVRHYNGAVEANACLPEEVKGEDFSNDDFFRVAISIGYPEIALLLCPRTSDEVADFEGFNLIEKFFATLQLWEKESKYRDAYYFLQVFEYHAGCIADEVRSVVTAIENGEYPHDC